MSQFKDRCLKNLKIAKDFLKTLELVDKQFILKLDFKTFKMIKTVRFRSP